MVQNKKKNDNRFKACSSCCIKTQDLVYIKIPRTAFTLQLVNFLICLEFK